jgi:hypothetical protein
VSTFDEAESQHSVGEFAPCEVPAEVVTLFAVSSASAVRGALGTVYFSWAHWAPSPLLVLDWDVKDISAALPTYLDHTFERLAQLQKAHRVVTDPDEISLYAETKGLGRVVLLEAQKGGFNVREVSDAITELDLDERATQALVLAHAGQVKLSRPAFEKTLNFRGTAANHLRRQIAQYSNEQRADSAELLNAWCTGVLQALI